MLPRQEQGRMKQKIEWYREVLEIEPNSKVFFPLARILVADKQVDEAISVLTIGLSRHPYFIEARLLLVELLFAGGRHERLWHEVDMVSAMLGGYPGFWRAWAERLSLEDGSRDTALAVSFVAASLQKLPISWTEVIEHGLRACFAKNGLSAPLPESQGQTGKMSRTSSTADSSGRLPGGGLPGDSQGGTVTPAASRSDLAVNFGTARGAGPQDRLAEDFTDIEGELASEAPDESSADLAGLMDDGETDLVADSAAFSGTSAAPEEKITLDAPESSAASSGRSDAARAEETAADDLFPAEEDLSAVESATGRAAGRTEGPVVPTTASEAETAGHDEDDDLENEEVYSLRTRSMAGILAEQGDYLGAREIYLELMSTAANEAELLELKECAEEMRKKHSSQGQEQPAKPMEEAAFSQGVRMNEQVMNKLKNLVDRLESRSQS